MENSQLTISSRIKKVRKEYLHLTQAQMAEKIPCSASSIGNYEKGTHVPPIRYIEKLSELSGVSKAWLCGDTNIETENENIYLDAYHSLINLAKTISAIPDTTFQISTNDNNGNINITTRDARFVKILNDLTEKQELINNNVIDHEFLDIWAQYLSDKLKK